MEKQNTKDSRSGLEESAVQQDIHSIHTEQTVSDRQQNTFGKDQSEMIYAELVGLKEELNRNRKKLFIQLSFSLNQVHRRNKKISLSL